MIIRRGGGLAEEEGLIGQLLGGPEAKDAWVGYFIEDRYIEGGM